MVRKVPPSVVRRGRVRLWERYERATARRYETLPGMRIKGRHSVARFAPIIGFMRQHRSLKKDSLGGLTIRGLYHAYHPRLRWSVGARPDDSKCRRFKSAARSMPLTLNT
jgi:hypothetical protein